MGSAKFLVFYLLAGVAAFALQIAIDTGSDVPNIGASGAVAGVLGGYILLYPRARVLTFLFIILFFTVIELPAPSPGRQAMPMMAPDVRYAFCRFDLANGPIRLRAAIADELWLIALYTPEGENFYTVAGADMKRAQLDLIIAAADRKRWLTGASAVMTTAFIAAGMDGTSCAGGTTLSH